MARKRQVKARAEQRREGGSAIGEIGGADVADRKQCWWQGTCRVGPRDRRQATDPDPGRGQAGLGSLWQSRKTRRRERPEKAAGGWTA